MVIVVEGSAERIARQRAARRAAHDRIDPSAIQSDIQLARDTMLAIEYFRQLCDSGIQIIRVNLEAEDIALIAARISDAIADRIFAGVQPQRRPHP